MSLPFIDVVVCTFNRASMLEEIVSSLMAQTYPAERYLVTVVDDGSVDETWTKLEQMAASQSRLRPLRIAHAGLSAARNYGWRSAQGDIVAFTDDDCLADPGWLAAVARTFADHPEALGAVGKTVTVPERVTPLTHQVVVSHPNTIYHGCNMAYRREVLSAVGGFDEGAHYAEDSQFAAAVLIRGPILFAPEIVIIHPPRPRVFLDRERWTQRLEGALRLYCRYPAFYRRNRGVNFLTVVLLKWVLGATVKNILIELPWLFRNPTLYSRFLVRLLRERWTLLTMFPAFWRAHRSWVKGLQAEENRDRVDSVGASK
jgi:glycosyltransferase involved in cell wall biosynthesis